MSPKPLYKLLYTPTNLPWRLKLSLSDSGSIKKPYSPRQRSTQNPSRILTATTTILPSNQSRSLTATTAIHPPAVKKLLRHDDILSRSPCVTTTPGSVKKPRISVKPFVPRRFNQSPSRSLLRHDDTRQEAFGPRRPPNLSRSLVPRRFTRQEASRHDDHPDLPPTAPTTIPTPAKVSYQDDLLKPVYQEAVFYSHKLSRRLRREPHNIFWSGNYTTNNLLLRHRAPEDSAQAAKEVATSTHRIYYRVLSVYAATVNRFLYQKMWSEF